MKSRENAALCIITPSNRNKLIFYLFFKPHLSIALAKVGWFLAKWSLFFKSPLDYSSAKPKWYSAKPSRIVSDSHLAGFLTSPSLPNGPGFLVWQGFALLVYNVQKYKNLLFPQGVRGLEISLSSRATKCVLLVTSVAQNPVWFSGGCSLRRIWKKTGDAFPFSSDTRTTSVKQFSVTWTSANNSRQTGNPSQTNLLNRWRSR